MRLLRRRRSAVVLASLVAAAVAPLAAPGPAGAASSSVTVSDPGGPTLGSSTTPKDEPKADITTATARYQNDHISLTMKLKAGDDLSRPDDVMRWAIGARTESTPDFIVDFKRGTNGFGQVIVSKPGQAAVDCPGTSASFDVASATYLASLPAKCVGTPASFQWNAERRVTPTTGTEEPATDVAPDSGVADAVTPSTVFGYWAIGSDGKVYNFGDAPKLGETASAAKQMIDIEAAPHGSGYWTVDDRGVVTAFGPISYGSVKSTDLKAGERAVSMSGTPSGAGYWIFTNKGRVFAFGDATKDLGDVSTLNLQGEILDSSPTPSGKGYYLVGADGGVFALGDAKFEGSMGDTKLNMPVQSIVPDPDGKGYWLVASDGGVFAFVAPFKGSTGNIKLNKPMTGMVPYGDGYLMVAEDGGVFNFSNKPFSGSLGNNPPANPIVSITALS